MKNKTLERMLTSEYFCTTLTRTCVYFHNWSDNWMNQYVVHVSVLVSLIMCSICRLGNYATWTKELEWGSNLAIFHVVVIHTCWRTLIRSLMKLKPMRMMMELKAPISWRLHPAGDAASIWWLLSTQRLAQHVAEL